MITEPIGDELVIFDRVTHEAHLLAPQSAAIWRAAKNGCSLGDVVALLGAESGEDGNRLARLRVDELSRIGLVVTDLPAPPRRSLLKALGTLAAVPGVITILAPKAEALVSDCTRNITSCAVVGSNAPDCCAAAPDCRLIVGGLNTGTKRCCVGAGDRGAIGLTVLDAAECCSGSATLGLICNT